MQGEITFLKRMHIVIHCWRQERDVHLKQQWERSSTWFVIFGVVMIISNLLWTWSYFSTSYKPKAVSGVMDLRDWDITKQGAITLDGEWAFDWNQFTSPVVKGNRYSYKDSNHLMPVPGDWEKQTYNDQKLPVIGYATYRLHLQLPKDAPKQWGIKTLNIRLDNSMYVDGQLVGGNGTPGVTVEQSKSDPVPYVSYFEVKNTEVDIVIHISNFIGFSSGITQSIYFGTPKEIAKISAYNLGINVALICSFLMIGLYFCGLFLQRRRMTELADFAGLCFSAALFNAVEYERIFIQIFPFFTVKQILFIQVASAMFILIFLTRYLYRLFPELYHRNFMKWFQRIAFASIPMLFLIPERLYFWATVAICIWLGLFFLLNFTQMIRAYRLNKEGSKFIFVGTFSILTLCFQGILNIFYHLEPFAIIPIAQPIFILSQALFMSQRYTNAYLTIEELTSRLQRIDAVKDEFLAKTSHELKTPLNGILNITYSIVEGVHGPLQAKVREDLQLVYDIGKRLSFLVNDILDYSKMKNHNLTLKKRVFDAYPVVNSVVDTFKFSIENTNVNVVNDLTTGQIILFADENRFFQIIYNLIDNAMKYSGRGEIRISAEINGQLAWISVKDEGVGIPFEQQERIFQSFEQVEPSLTRTAGGVGLGLAITKQLVELHEGTIRVISEPGNGTEMRFSIPCAAAQDDENLENVEIDRIFNDQFTVLTADLLTEEVKANSNRGKIGKILIVDDELSNRRALQNILTLQGYELFEAVNGEEALSQLQKQPVDLVILDVMMPGMSGYEVAQRFREHFSQAELSILMLTAKSEPNDMKAGFLAGANDFLLKPFYAQELILRVQTLIQVKRAAADLLKKDLEFLQVQIDPHFIYNSLNTIIGLCYSEPQQAGKLLATFSQFLRSRLKQQDWSRRFTIEQELAHIKAYVELEKARFDERLDVVIDVDESVLQAKIEPLIVQPLIENAIQHGVMVRKAGGLVQLIIRKQEDQIHIMVSDDGVGFDPDQLSLKREPDRGNKHIGLRNILKRISFLPDTQIQITSEKNQGTSIIIQFPMR